MSETMQQPIEAPRKVWGWKDIATELDVSERTAKEFAARDRDPLPVEHGHKGVWAYATALRDWVRRQNVPYKVRLEQVRAERAQAKARAQAKTASARAALASKQGPRQGRRHSRTM